MALNGYDTAQQSNSRKRTSNTSNRTASISAKERLDIWV